ncbi:MAG: hypothetical protein K6D02_05090 [Lachnospiraceae bacterium]|nr:hypothetical protein [Lachnospiraceae bacterium]
MKEESTTGLNNILNSIKKENMDEYLDKYGEDDKTVISKYFMDNNISISAISRTLNGYMSKSYLYDIVNGVKTSPTRDYLIMICIAAQMDRKSIRRVLESYELSDLYPKNKRDIIIATNINNKVYDLDVINEELVDHGLKPLTKEN